MTTSELKTNYLMPYVFSESSISAYSLPSAVIVSLYTYGYNVNRFGKADFLMEISPAGSISTAVHIEDAEMFQGSDRNLSFALAIGALVASSCWLLYTYMVFDLIFSNTNTNTNTNTKTQILKTMRLQRKRVRHDRGIRNCD